MCYNEHENKENEVNEMATKIPVFVIPYAKAIASLKEKSLKQYTDIMAKIDPADPAWQKKFVTFYRVRRDEAWRKKYFDLMAKYLGKKPTFDTVLDELHAKTGRVEASFASKLVATLDNTKPIWDSKVLTNLGCKNTIKSYWEPEKRLTESKDLYHELERTFMEVSGTSGGKDSIAAFDSAFPAYKDISDMKKLDFLVWAL